MKKGHEMRSRAYGAGFLLGLAIVLFYGAFVQDIHRMYQTTAFLKIHEGLGSKSTGGILAMEVCELAVSGAKALEAKLSEAAAEEESEIQAEQEEKKEGMYWLWDSMEIDEVDRKVPGLPGITLLGMGQDIAYPYLGEMETGYSDQVNMLLEQDIKERCSGEFNSYDIEYRVTYFDEDYISVLYQGDVYHAETLHPYDMAWGITIDIKAGEVVAVEDIMELSELQEKLTQKEFEKVGGEEDIDSHESRFDEGEDWYTDYEKYAVAYDNGNHLHNFYLKKDKIGIIYGYSGRYLIVEIDR